MGKETELAIVFADVVGSTKLYERLGDLRARDMVGVCIEVMRTATEQNHGQLIERQYPAARIDHKRGELRAIQGRGQAKHFRRILNAQQRQAVSLMRKVQYAYLGEP